LGQESEYNAPRIAKKTIAKLKFIAILFDRLYTRFNPSSQVLLAYPQFKKNQHPFREEINNRCAKYFSTKNLAFVKRSCDAVPVRVFK